MQNSETPNPNTEKPTEDTITFKFHPSYFSSRSAFYNTLESSKEVQDHLQPKNPPIQIKNIHGMKLLGVPSELKKEMQTASEEAGENGRESPTLVYIPPLATPQEKSAFENVQQIFYLCVVIDIGVLCYSFLQRLGFSPLTKIPNFILFGFNLILNFMICLCVKNESIPLITASFGVVSTLFFINLVIIQT